MLASKGGHTETVLLLLEHLAEINVVGCVLSLSQDKICTPGEDKQGDCGVRALRQ